MQRVLALLRTHRGPLLGSDRPQVDSEGEVVTSKVEVLCLPTAAVPVALFPHAEPPAHAPWPPVQSPQHTARVPPRRAPSTRPVSPCAEPSAHGRGPISRLQRQELREMGDRPWL